MRTGNLSNRLVLIVDDQRALDVERASDGRFGSDPQRVFDRWDEFREWADGAPVEAAEAFDPQRLGPPVPRPPQIFAIGLNYGDHIAETNSQASPQPPVFTKFISAITGPYASVEHPGGSVDWEVELVVVIGREARRVPAGDAWSYVAGLTAGQDISERETQHAGLVPQFSLGKSFPGFTPMGPWVVTPDEIADPDDIGLECWVNGDLVQKARTSEMIMSVRELIARLSNIVTLLPGDVIYTGTPAGVGMGRKPPRFLDVGDELVTKIDGIGDLRTSIVAGR
jgi:2,4-didehydro-3-deoxy-L-rhamnonate hydrolase